MGVAIDTSCRDAFLADSSAAATRPWGVGDLVEALERQNELARCVSEHAGVALADVQAARLVFPVRL